MSEKVFLKDEIKMETTDEMANTHKKRTKLPSEVANQRRLIRNREFSKNKRRNAKKAEVELHSTLEKLREENTRLTELVDRVEEAKKAKEAMRQLNNNVDMSHHGKISSLSSFSGVDILRLNSNLSTSKVGSKLSSSNSADTCGNGSECSSLTEEGNNPFLLSIIKPEKDEEIQDFHLFIKDENDQLPTSLSSSQPTAAPNAGGDPFLCHTCAQIHRTLSDL